MPVIRECRPSFLQNDDRQQLRLARIGIARKQQKRRSARPDTILKSVAIRSEPFQESVPRIQFLHPQQQSAVALDIDDTKAAGLVLETFQRIRPDSKRFPKAGQRNRPALDPNGVKPEIFPPQKRLDESRIGYYLALIRP